MYSKHGKLADAASGAKASTKHLWPKSRSEVIQGHTFGDHWKADEGLHTLYNNAGLISKIDE